MIKQAKFVISVADGKSLYETAAPEIAVAGKSNVGKSSFINFLTNQNKLAKTSGDPGRTRLLNYFEINNGEYFFVDLPGYGYAKVSKQEQRTWGGMIDAYLLTSKNLCHVFVLVDIRHNPTADDKTLINFLFSYRIPFTIIATKCDKLSRLQLSKMRRIISSDLGVGEGNIYLTSASNKTGKTEIFERIDQILSNLTASEDAIE